MMDRIGIKERAYVQEVLDSQLRASTSCTMVKRLEEKFSEVFKSRFAISFVNGTATMHAVLSAAGVNRGDEVIVPPLTMASTSLAVLHCNATPVFADVDERTWTIDPASIEKCVTSRTKAVIPVAIYGLPPNMDAILETARKHRLFVLVDSAQCFLGYHRGSVVGSIGDASSFSFQGSKHMASGEGGMITTNDESLADSIRCFNSLGYAAVSGGVGKGRILKDTIQDPKYERHVSIGWNYRMPQLCAAVALGQLERLEELVEMRKRVASLYGEAVGKCSWLAPQEVPTGDVHSYWTYVLRLSRDVDFDWYQFRRKYMEFGGDGIYAAWQLTYLEPVFRNGIVHSSSTQTWAPGLCPVAESIQPRLLQFKTNYFTMEKARVASEALRKTINYFGS